MVDHGARAHALWSASATARNWACPGALALQQVAPADVESEAAARGTACHQVADICLRKGGDAIEHLGTTQQTKTKSIKIDEELVGSAQTYLDYVRERMSAYAAGGGGVAALWVEQRFSLEALSPPFEAGGTGDAVLYFPTWEMLEVVDLKNGVGVVNVTGNPQLRSYGLGALLKNQGLRVRKVRVTIVQPRVHHPDGRVRSETFHIADLIEWTGDLLDAMRRSEQAMKAFPGTQAVQAFDEWCERWLKPGVCKFCRAEGFCPALRRRAQQVAETWFDAGAAPATRAPSGMPLADLARALDMANMVESWIEAVRSYAHTLAETGTAIPGYRLVEKRPRRAWNDDEAVVARQLATATKRPAADFFEHNLRSPAQVDKLVGASQKHLVAPFWSSKSSGTNLVRADKTEGVVTIDVASRYFEPQEK